MHARIANKVRVRKGTIPENVLLELENTEVAGSSTPSGRTPTTAIIPASVLDDLEVPSGKGISDVPEGPPLVEGELRAVRGEPSKSQKRKCKSKSRSKSRSKSESQSSRSTKSSKQKRLEARLEANAKKEEDNVKIL
ncbi:UNVERIFIED_CONTAM: hypothetical protein Sradi_4388100 [Sesamum radiatum]|uniref:Uncharacterized protein n=1 Tax=Sesamum radiatum TaxID=300843 RepID=A0AAW2NQ68_SESRA